MDNEQLITEFNLPNFKFKRRTRTPEYLRNVCSRTGMIHLEKRLSEVNTPVHSENTTPKMNMTRPATAGQRVMHKVRHKRVYMEEMATMNFKHFDTPVELVAMAQFRKGLMKEIESHHFHMTPEHIEKVRCNSVQQDLLDLQKLKRKKQDNKIKRELISRSHLGNAIYMLRALPNSTRAVLAKSLNEILPPGSRFHQLSN
ncbi:hypothetical protein SteCoe_29015 [Stentor coeruleus]|uniref:Uncharacterized protein n=1 Tax=Stentor coeruleus TaxID=5963 RepID=A0A1R2B6Y2_9CILI|nr:hypothetical protein SteCoe_29015 [Stentor coeruleus]